MYRVGWLTPNGRDHLVAVMGEFIGSYLCLLFGCLIMQESATMGNDEHMKVIMGSIGFGFSMCITIYMFNDVSGVHLTPPITIAQTLAGKSPYIRVFFFIPAQIIAGIAASYSVDAMTPGEAAFAPKLAEHVTVAQGFFIEMFGTSMIVLPVLFITLHTKNVTPAVVIIAPCIGIAGFIAHMFSLYYTGGSLNPARAIGSCLADRHTFPPGFWIYIIAPLVGAILSTLLFELLLAVRLSGYVTRKRGKQAFVA